MDLSRAVGTFAKIPIEIWNRASLAWEESGSTGGLQVYDRFISDRAFGQKKRILTTAGESTLPSSAELLRLEGYPEIYLIESQNQDITDSRPHTNVYMLHECPYVVEVCKEISQTRASGAPQTAGEEIVETTWCDMDRYSALNSREFETVDYTVMTVYLAISATVDADCYLKIGGEVFDVNESSTQLGVRFLRVQKRG